MKQTTCFLIVLLWSFTMFAAKIKYPGKKTFIYRYALIDKASTEFTLDQPLQFLSQKSLERRKRQGLSVDSTDLPVCKQYIRQFHRKGIHIIGTSRWQNTILASSSDSLLLASLDTLSIVRKSTCVFVSPDSIEHPGDIRWNVHEDFNRWDSVKNDPYGMARQQIETLEGIFLHEMGYRGKGITIAVLDGGFQNYKRIPAFKRTNILGTHDFIKPREDKKYGAFESIDHGTKVLSAMAAYAPEVTIGTAPEASYWLLRCEDPLTEQPVEEDYWTMAVEMADSCCKRTSLSGVP